MLTKAIINDAISAHNFWKMRLRTMIETGIVGTSIDTIRNDAECQFGKWLYGPALTMGDRHDAHYKTLCGLHSQFHAAAASVAEAASAGKVEDAKKMMAPGGAYFVATQSLESALTEWKTVVS